MRTVIVRQIRRRGDIATVAFHKFQMPEVRDHGFYRTSISYSAFFESGKRRNWSHKYLFTIQGQGEEDMRRDWEKDADAKVPVVEHESLYDFLSSINYCRKTKKIHDPIEQPTPDNNE